jgi:hypothetical protein
VGVPGGPSANDHHLRDHPCQPEPKSQKDELGQRGSFLSHVSLPAVPILSRSQGLPGSWCHPKTANCQAGVWMLLDRPLPRTGGWASNSPSLDEVVSDSGEYFGNIAGCRYDEGTMYMATLSIYFALFYLIAGEFVALLALGDRKFSSRLKISDGWAPYALIVMAIICWPMTAILLLSKED